MPRIERSHGYTLIEVIAALAILGFGLSILYAGYLEAIRQEGKYAGTDAALRLARSVLAQAEAGAADGPGSDGDYSWTITREPLGEPGLDRLIVTITWSQGGPRSLQAWTVVSHGP